MQQHSGATITVITHIHPFLKSRVANLPKKQFLVRSTTPVKTKLHSIKLLRHDPLSREAEFECGVDYPCYVKVRFNYPYEEVEFYQHRYENIREKFRIYPGTRIDGEYLSETSGLHRLDGRIISPKKTRFYDYFAKEKKPTQKRAYRYEFEVIAQY